MPSFSSTSVLLLLFQFASVAAIAQSPTPADTCSLANGAGPSFCDTFDKVYKGGRAGDLDPAKWNFYRITNVTNPGQGNLMTFYPSTAQFCDILKDGFVPDGDSFTCGPEFAEPRYWLTTLNDNGGRVWMGSRALQPLDFANRTGTISWSVDAKTAGSHTYWTDLWITDEPTPGAHEATGAGDGFQPRNGIGINFGGTACLPGFDPQRGAGATLTDDSVSTGGVESLTMVRDYAESSLSFTADANSCYTVQSDHSNRFELRISKDQLELWASDANPQEGVGASGPNFRRILSVSNLNLPFTRGYVYFQHEHYNAAKEGVTPMQTYHWHDIAFDGRVLPPERDYQVPDALVPSRDGGINLGYPVDSSGVKFQVRDVDISNAVQAWLTLVFNYSDNPTSIQFRYRLNGKSWRTFTDPKKSTGGGSAVMPIDVAELLPGDNTIEIATANEPATIGNIDLLVDLATGSSSPPVTTISNLQVTNLTSSSATITWQTNNPSDSQVEYGLSAEYGSMSGLQTLPVTTHVVTLSSLNSATIYHFRADSKDAAGALAVSADLTFATSVAAPPPGTLLIGDGSLESGIDSRPAGTAVAFRYVAALSGNAQSIHVYLDAGNSARKVVVALYDHNSTIDGPGNLLATATLVHAVAGAWNLASIPSVNITSNAVYWIVLLSPAGSGRLMFRDHLENSSVQNSSQTSLTSIPTAWTAVPDHTAPMSAFLTP